MFTVDLLGANVEGWGRRLPSCRRYIERSASWRYATRPRCGDRPQSPRPLRRLSFWAWRRTRSRWSRVRLAMAARQRSACDATSSAVKVVSRGALTPSCLRSSGVRSLGLSGGTALARLLGADDGDVQPDLHLDGLAVK